MIYIVLFVFLFAAAMFLAGMLAHELAFLGFFRLTLWLAGLSLGVTVLLMFSVAGDAGVQNLGYGMTALVVTLPARLGLLIGALKGRRKASRRQ